MKRIVTISAILLAVGYTVAARQAGAQTSPNKAHLDEAAKQYRAAEERARKAAEASGEARSEDQQALRDKLRPLVEETFVARQKFQSAEVEMLGRRLAEVTQTINDREKNKEAIIDARIDELLNPGQVSDTEKNEPVSQIDLLKEYAAAKKELDRARRLFDTGSVTEGVLRAVEKKFYDSAIRLQRAEVEIDPFVKPQAAPGAPLNDFSSPQAPHLPTDTRERLARLELEEAIAKRDLARNDFEIHKGTNEKVRGSTPDFDMRKLEATVQLAEIGVKRANVNLEGLARQRAELESRADAAIAEATAAQQKAAAGVRISEANREAAQAQLQKAEADLEAAEAHQKFRDKQHQRIKGLVKDRAVDEKLVDESEEHLAKAKTDLTGAQSTVANAKANVDQTTSAIDEAKAALKVADLRLLAAQAHRDRLKQRAEAKNDDPVIPATKPAADAP